MEERPFVHLFKCSTGNYLYDVNTDLIFKISNETYDILMDSSIKKENAQIKKLKSAGCLKSNRVKVSEHPMTAMLKSFYANNLNAITLQLTQNCNLRCEYCLYSGKYNTRTHNDKKMSINVAKRSIDFLLEHSFHRKKITIGFYGGEPLLEFEMIKECVAYVQQNAKNREVVYLITTNATLLTPNIIDYLVRHKFEITISFDGPKEIHDKYRKFPNNDGSYDIVMKNVQFIRDHYYDYFQKYVSFNTVLSPQESYECIGNFIKGEDVFDDVMFTTSIVSDIGLKEKQNIVDSFYEEYNYEYFKLLMSKIGKVQDKNISVVVKSDFKRMFLMRGGNHRKGYMELPNKWHHSGPCVPGQRSIFVNVEGIFYPCERVCEIAEVTIIGNVWDGIDISKAAQVLNIEKITEAECQNCWAYRNCNSCIRFADPDENNLAGNILKHCNEMKKLIEATFKDYCVLREVGYDFETDNLKQTVGEK